MTQLTTMRKERRRQLLLATRDLKTDLEAQGLRVSTSKTAFICSNRAAGKAVTSLVGPQGPQVIGVGKDLGLDSAAGARTNHNGEAKAPKRGR